MARQPASIEPLGFPNLFSGDELEGRIPASDVVRVPSAPEPSDQDLAVMAAERLRNSFPRIHDQIGTVWGSAACEDYLDKLILDDRGDRAGFPPPVMEALLILQRLHYKQFGSFRPTQPWDIAAHY